MKMDLMIQKMKILSAKTVGDKEKRKLQAHSKITDPVTFV